MLSEKPWRPEHVLQLLIRLFASFLAGMLLVGWLNSVSWLGPNQVKFLSVAVGTLSFHGMAVLLIYYFLRERGMSWDEAFGFRSPPLDRTLLLAVLVGLAVLPIALSLGQVSAKLMNSIHMQPVVQGPVQMLQASTTFEMRLMIGFLAIVVAPFAEELVFRGLIYPTLKQFGTPRLALWGTSILFAAIHTNLMSFLPLIFLAVVLTLLYETTDNLLGPILAHSLFNFVNFFWVVSQPAKPASLWLP